MASSSQLPAAPKNLPTKPQETESDYIVNNFQAGGADNKPKRNKPLGEYIASHLLHFSTCKLEQHFCVTLSSNVSSEHTKLRQQKLPAWQPILTASTVIPTVFGIGIVFLPIGIALFIANREDIK
ncbi:unnamed protein product [Thelazia callipaeda]|uniref:Cell cycle control protein 50A n=1 Tax=Thelazia callipaeda TaxID=103827 RepID=A0A0N5CUT2_THECL|nr:unnamed protein product [Thelazia callipaeda]